MPLSSEEFQMAVFHVKEDLAAAAAKPAPPEIKAIMQRIDALSELPDTPESRQEMQAVWEELCQRVDAIKRASAPAGPGLELTFEQKEDLRRVVEEELRTAVKKSTAATKPPKTRFPGRAYMSI